MTLHDLDEAGVGRELERGDRYVVSVTSGVRNFVYHSEPTTIEHYIDHFDYVRDLIGVEHLGIGSDIDLDGYDDMPADQRDKLLGSYKSSYAFRDKLDTDGFDDVEEPSVAASEEDTQD